MTNQPPTHLSNKLTPLSRILLEKLIVLQLVKKYAACYRVQMFMFIFRIK